MQEVPPVVDHAQTIPPFPLPTDDQAIALRIAAEYLTLVGTQTATSLLGCPPLTGDTKLLASISNSLLRGAALCEGLVDLIDLLGET
jgi:hypothetical protein